MRIGYSEDEEFGGQFELWQANCRRSLKGKKGQAALRELEAALLAMPDKRLIAGKLQDADGEVCSLGALAKYKGHALLADECEEGEYDEYDLSGEMEEFGVELGMLRLVAWKVVEKNDVAFDGMEWFNCEGPYRWEFERPQMRDFISPEMRYEKMLAWIRKQLTQPPSPSSPDNENQ
jgi:hypothetical protein